MNKKQKALLDHCIQGVVILREYGIITQSDVRRIADDIRRSAKKEKNMEKINNNDVDKYKLEFSGMKLQ